MRLKLTKGYFAVVDNNDPKKPWKYKWWAQVDYRANGNIRTVYANRTLVDSEGKKSVILLHRFLLGITDPAIEVDHKDGDGLNNKRKNLKAVSKSENQRQRSIRSEINASGIRGVFPTQSKKWKALIGKVYLGVFPSKTSAKKAVEKYLKERVN